VSAFTCGLSVAWLVDAIVDGKPDWALAYLCLAALNAVAWGMQK
jgi:hypothetical protein